VTPQAYFTADDFGLSVAVNEAVEQAHRLGVLHAASLMVAGPAAADAVARARRLPGLRVGLHLVAIEGPAVLPHAAIPDLVDPAGFFPPDQVRRALAYAARPKIRRQLAAEFSAQFAAYAATGLTLHHADAHKHMHLHPVVARLMIAAGRAHGLPRLRIPAEPPAVLAACGEHVGPGARALYRWTRTLRSTARRAGLATPDHCFGIHWSGGMTADRLLRLAPHLPPGVSEIYFHPATRRDATLARLMPHYRHTEELSALLDPRVREAYAARHGDIVDRPQTHP
jgi:hopanoid biosynthesis associated protein HpnK